MRQIAPPQEGIRAIEDGPAPGARLVPESKMDQAILRSLINSAVNAGGDPRLYRPGLKPAMKGARAYWHISLDQEFNAEGYLPAQVIIMMGESESMLGDMKHIPARLWVTYDEYSGRLTKWWALDTTDYTLGHSQSNTFPEPPILTLTEPQGAAA